MLYPYNKSSYHTGILIFLHVLPRRARLSLLWIPIRVSSVFHPWLKDLLLRYFQGRVFDRWRRNKPEPAFRISSPSPRFGRSRLSFKSGTYCRPVPWRAPCDRFSLCSSSRECMAGLPEAIKAGILAMVKAASASWENHTTLQQPLA